MKPRLESIFRTVEHLGEATGDADVADEVRLAAILAQHLGAETLPRLVALLSHPNAHARRVAVQAVGRARFWASPVVLDIVVERLADPVGGVRLDAASALAGSGTSSADAIEALHRLARGASLDDTVDVSDDAQRARVAAARALVRLCMRRK
jgi:hypothetical protein